MRGCLAGLTLPSLAEGCIGLGRVRRQKRLPDAALARLKAENMSSRKKRTALKGGPLFQFHLIVCSSFSSRAFTSSPPA